MNDSIVPNFYEEIEESDLTFFEIKGRGAYGMVRRAEFRGKIVAVKYIHSESESNSFIAELKQLSRVNHENIVKLHGGCSIKQPVFLVMEYCDTSLYNVLHIKPLPAYTAAHAISWCLQCARGVEYLHNIKPKPIVHRDLKPPNLLLLNHGLKLKICDFGTARDLQTFMTNNTGSAAWMAPEVFESETYNEKCDVFSWGIILWEVLTRRKPFEEISFCNQFGIMWAVHNGTRPPPIQNCPKSLDFLMARCWMKDPSRRPSMTEITQSMNYHMQFFKGADQPLVFPEPEEEEEDELGSHLYFANALYDTDGLTETLHAQAPAAILPHRQYGEDEGDLVIMPELASTVQPTVIEEAPITSLHSAPGSLYCSDENLYGLRAGLSNVDQSAGGFADPLFVNVDDVPSTSSVSAVPKKGHRRGGSYDTALIAHAGDTGEQQRLLLESANATAARSSKPKQPFSKDGMKLPLQNIYSARQDAPAEEEESFDADSARGVPMAYLFLDNHLRPVPPCFSSKESVAVYREHCAMAEEYFKMQEEIELLLKRKQVLIAELDQDLKGQSNSYRLQEEFEQLLNEKERLMNLHVTLKEQLEDLRWRKP